MVDPTLEVSMIYIGFIRNFIFDQHSKSVNTKQVYTKSKWITNYALDIMLIYK